MQHLDMAPTEVHDQKPVGGPSYAKKSKPATNLIIPNCWDFSFLSVRILFYLKFEVLNLIRFPSLKYGRDEINKRLSWFSILH